MVVGFIDITAAVKALKLMLNYKVLLLKVFRFEHF